MEYSPFWFSVLIAIGVVFISLAILFGLKIAYSEDLPCLKYSNGVLAIIERYCQGEYETITWFLERGYNIDAVTLRTGNGEYSMIYMSRHP